jgi:hypothetical protein
MKACRLVVVLVPVLGTLLALGCGEENKSLTAADFDNQYAKDICAAVTPACLIPETACTASQLLSRVQQDQEAMSNYWLFSPSNAQTCLNQVNSTYGKLRGGTVALKAADMHSVDQACKDVYRGTRVANEACNVDKDCVANLICDHSKGTLGGRCGAPSTVMEGGGCANIGEVCPAGSYCGNSAGVFVCQPKFDLGAACSETVPCLESLRCAGGLCITQLGIGEVCAADLDCATNFCEPYALRCAEDVRFANGSAACLALGGTTH